MKRNMSIDIALTPREIEEEVWNMDSENQIELLKYFVWRYESTKHYPVMMQMQNIYDSMKVFCDEDERRSIINLISEFLDFISDDRVVVHMKKEDREPYEERKKGKWIRGSFWNEGCGMGETYGYYYKCSECGAEVKNDYKNCSYNVCPRCGAKMEGSEEEDDKD